MHMNLNLRILDNNQEDYARIAEIFNASAQADHMTITLSAEDMAEELARLEKPGTLSGSPQPWRNLVLAEVEGQAVGFGRVRWEEESQRRLFKLTGYIHPEWRRKGIGQAVLSWLEEKAREIARESPTAMPGILRINASQFQVGLHALAQQAGYGVKECWALLVRSNLEDIPEALLPEGLEVRPALPEHFSAIWYAVEEAYVPEGAPPPSGVMPEELMHSANFQPELWQVAWEISSEKVVGSVMTYINHAENRRMGIRRGYTEGISTVPGWQRRGVARALIYRSLKAQREAGMTESALVCNCEKPGNMRLYARCGFQEKKVDTIYEKITISQND
jgi:GNAT superfamily N-acetyltransferase